MSKKQPVDTLDNEWREVLRTKAGQKIVWEILAMCGIYSDTFTGNSQTFYLEGKRAIGLQILQAMEDADPTAYARLLLEHQKQIQPEGENNA